MIELHPQTETWMDPIRRVLDEPVSASRLNLFHSCRLKFFFQYIQRKEKPATLSVHVGQAVHALLEDWNKRRWLGKPLAMETLRANFEDHWKLLLEDKPVVFEKAEELLEKEKAWLLVEMYLRETPIPTDEKPMGVEVFVEKDLKEHGLPTLRGVIDLIRPDGEIVDFKTTAVTPKEEMAAHQNQIQLTCYALLYREATGTRENGFALHHLVKSKTPKLVVTKHPKAGERETTKLLRALESYVNGIEREDWIPSPGLQCLSCSYFNECRKEGTL